MQLPDPSAHDTPEQLLAAIHGYIDAATAALEAKRIEDLAGLDAVVDTLCARVKALPAERGGEFRGPLSSLHDRLSILQAQMVAAKQAMEEELREINARQRASKAYRKDES
jgi:hypothetical protein